MRDATSFDEFYSARAERLVRLVYARTGDLGRAEDCVQEAFIRAWRRWGRLEGDDPVGWVTTVAWRLAIKDWHRRRREHDAWRGRPDFRTDVPAELLELRDALGRLPRAQADVLLLHYLQDLSIRRIATLLAMPEGTVKSHLSRGRAALATSLDPGGAPA
ncbi:SigE family RNA polymerase sigma factor [Nocardioides lentus]|uniref:SigE family RNA polymerase sigma factor n=1 Tax=Nocardioides lentus TaxID=338077 RepID=A0ABP5AAD6_9ACTN